MKNSFHGRTFATLTATGQDKVQKDYEPLLPGFRYVAFNKLEELERAVTDKTAAVLLEPIQGEGGVHVADREYLKQVRDLCSKKDLLLIFDEIQTGMGRTGTLFAYEQLGVQPDIMTLAKGLGGGVPIGACLATDSVAKAFSPGAMLRHSVAIRSPVRPAWPSVVLCWKATCSIMRVRWGSILRRAYPTVTRDTGW